MGLLGVWEMHFSSNEGTIQDGCSPAQVAPFLRKLKNLNFGPFAYMFPSPPTDELHARLRNTCQEHTSSAGDERYEPVELLLPWPKNEKNRPFWAHVDANYRAPMIGPGFDTCVSDIPIHLLNYPEELAAIR